MQKDRRLTNEEVGLNFCKGGVFPNITDVLLVLNFSLCITTTIILPCQFYESLKPFSRYVLGTVTSLFYLLKWPKSSGMFLLSRFSVKSPSAISQETNKKKQNKKKQVESNNAPQFQHLTHLPHFGNNKFFS